MFLISALQSVFTTFVLLEPKMNLESFIKKTSHDKLELIRKFLDVEPEVSFKNLHITLPWDPVSHACEEMDFLKQALQPEKLIEVDSTKQRYLPTDLYSEGFDMVLNSSGTSKLSKLHYLKG